MAALIRRAGTLGGFDELVAAKLRGVGANYARTEDEVAQVFTRMRSELE